MADCLNCGASVASDAKYCRSCGAPLSGPSPVQSSAAAHVSAPVNASASAPDGVRDAQPRKSGWADLGSVSVSAVSQGQQNQPAQASNPIQHGQVQQTRIQHGMSDAEKEQAGRVMTDKKTQADGKKNIPIAIIGVLAVVIVALVVLIVVNPFGTHTVANSNNESTNIAVNKNENSNANKNTNTTPAQLTVSKNVGKGGNAVITTGEKTKTATSHPKAGDTVYIEVTPSDGYKLTTANYKTEKGSPKALTKVSGDSKKLVYSFTMPSEDVTVNIGFEKK